MSGSLLRPHPIAGLVPSMTTGEFIELKRDIEQHGLLEPCWTFEGKILDGRHRYRACRELGIPCPTWEFVGDVDAARALVISANVHRRHLTIQQRRELITALLRSASEKSDRAIGKVTGADHKTVASVRAALQEGGEIPHHEARIGTDGVMQPATKPLPLLCECIAKKAHRKPPNDGMGVKRIRQILRALPRNILESLVIEALSWLPPGRRAELLARLSAPEQQKAA